MSGRAVRHSVKRLFSTHLAGVDHAVELLLFQRVPDNNKPVGMGFWGTLGINEN